MGIHPTAIISKKAKIHETASLGPYVIVRGKVDIGPRAVIDQFVTLGGGDYSQVQVGEACHIFAGAVIGEEPQSINYKGELSSIVIGKNTKIREYATIHGGTQGGTTHIGNHCMLMAYTHVAHDCQIGDNVVMANLVQLAGHVQVEDWVQLGGGSVINQFVRLGKHSYLAGHSTVVKDILPFTITRGNPAVMRAVNQIGMDRRGYSKEEIASIRKALRIIIKSENTLEQSLIKIQEECEKNKVTKSLLEFAKRPSERGLAL